MSLSWLATATVESSGFVLRGDPAGRSADLHIGSDQVVVTVEGSSASLQWSDHRPAKPEPPEASSAWWVAPFATGRAGPIGVAISVVGKVAADAESVLHATNTGLNRFNRLGEQDKSVPLRARGHITMSDDADRDTLDALCSWLAADPSVRARLLDPTRVQRLIAYLADGAVSNETVHSGVRRTTVEVLTEMHLLGYEHKLGGRPIAGRPLPELDVVVDRVVERIAHNPYAQGFSVERETVADLVRQHYLDVAPWPFGAIAA